MEKNDQSFMQNSDLFDCGYYFEYFSYFTNSLCPVQ